VPVEHGRTSCSLLWASSNDAQLLETGIEYRCMPARGMVVVRVQGGEVLHEGRESRLSWIKRSYATIVPREPSPFAELYTRMILWNRQISRMPAR
jgi:hypothetical protein